jgi:AraC-like DNA-binding protein
MQIQLLPREVWQIAAHRTLGAPARQPSFANQRDVPMPRGLDCHALRIVLERIAIVIFLTRDPAEGETTDPSTVQATRSMQKIERRADGALHIHVISTALAERLVCVLRQSASGEAPALHPRVARDLTIERLARALPSNEDVYGVFDETYANAVGVAIVTRLIAVHIDSVSRNTEQPNSGLQKWRLQRVINYVDAHLAEVITLAHMAEVAGLTRMHFARQFRVATGIRPHEYLLRRRIESAQELLRSSRSTLVEIALSVGFQAQPHFTTIFKRIVGETPHRWRTSLSAPLAAAPPCPRDRVGSPSRARSSAVPSFAQ